MKSAITATYISPEVLQGWSEGQGHVMPKQVMIVEDNELNMKLFRDLIEASGYEHDPDPQRHGGARSRAQASPRSDPDGHPAAGGFRAWR